MERRIRWLDRGALLLFLVGMATGVFGSQYAIDQRFPEGVPPGQDTDWIGVEWIGAGMGMWALAVLCLFSSCILRLARRWPARTVESS